MKKLAIILLIYLMMTSASHSQEMLHFLKTFGNAGTGIGEFYLSLNSYVTHDGVNIYIVDSNNDRIQKFDVDGNFLEWFGYKDISATGPIVDGLYVNNFGWYTTGSPNSQFNFGDGDAGIEIDSNKNMYICANNAIWKFDENGVFLKKINLNFAPRIFTIDDMGSIFVKKEDRVTYAKFDEDGNELFSFGGFGSDDGEFGDIGSAIRMHCDLSGNVYIVDWNQYRIQVFNSTGTFIRKWSANGLGSFWCDTNLENDKYYTKSEYVLYEYDLYGNLLQEYNIPDNDVSLNSQDRFLVFNNRLFIVSMTNHEAHIFEFSDNELPTANAGSDQIVFDEITLNGSLSDDPDGNITSYQWQLVHRVDSAYNRSAEGETPTVTDLKHGFYDVTLTVEDDEGAIDIDEMFFSATGLKGDFDFNGNVDGSDLSEFAENFGTSE